MEADIVDNRVIGFPEIVVKACTVAGAATGDDEVEVMGGKPKMEAPLGTGRADWVMDSLV